MSLVAIADLLTADFSASRLIAVDDEGQARRMDALRHDVMTLVTDLHHSGAASAFLVAEDTYWFAAGLLACLHAGLPVVLPPLAQVGMLMARRVSGDVLLADGVVSGHVPDIRLDRRVSVPSPLAPIDSERAELFFSTSGSTGEPKRVGKRLIHLQREILALEGAFGAEVGSGPVLSTVANHHIYGILFYVLWPLARGIPFATRQAAHWAPLLARLSDAILVSSPAHLGRLDAVDPLSAEGTPRVVFSSGGLLSPAAASQSNRILGQFPIEVFGSTETGGVAWRRQARTDTPWRLFPGVVASLSEDGLLQVRSRLFDEPLVEMGDRVRINDDGTFTFLGRADRIAKIESTRVSLTEIERALEALPGISEAATVLLPGRRDAVGAVIVPTSGGSLVGTGRLAVLRSIREALAPVLPRVALPRRIRVVDVMPTNSQGKRAEVDLRRLFEAKAPGGDIVSMGDPEVLAVRAGAERCELDLAVSAGLPCFSGHFPGRPVLAGVIQIDWAYRLAATHLGMQGGFAGLKGLKFRRLVEPGTRLLLILDRRGADRFGFDYRVDGSSVGTGEIQLLPP